MHAVIRQYSGSAAKELFNRLEEKKSEVEEAIRSVAGFVSYSLIRTDEGGISVTVCQDKSGAEQSVQIARDWVKDNASDLNTSPPVVSEGSVIIHAG